MSQDNEPITPKANHRVIDAEPTRRPNPHFKASDDSKSADEPFKTKPSFFAHISSGVTRFFQKLGWVFLISVVGLLGYLSWANNQNDWQIEHINTLQAQVSQLKSDLSALKQQQVELSQSVDAKKGLTQEQQTQIESIALLESKLDTLQQQVNEAQSKSLSTHTPAETVPKNNAADTAATENVGVKAELTQLSLDVQEMKRQLARLNNGQARLVSENTQLKNQLAGTPSTLSANQLQHWAMQINTDWMLTGDQYKTLNALGVLQKAVEQSDLTEKSSLLTQIALDQQALQNQLNVPSTEAASQAIAKLRAWIKQWKPAEKTSLAATTSSNADGVSHETDAPQTVWQKLQQKLLSLFSVRKRDSDEALTQVEKIAQQEVIKQRFELLLDRLEWAMVSHSQYQLQSSRDAMVHFVESQLSEGKSAFDSLFQPVASLQFHARQPLKVVGG
ncbi:hypothetical protein [Hydrogenovibrio marinus]|uniref:Uncharacterized protein n=1 Tax=Hydrogenovibrio marinus TaxID=28885 RepID=A0A067A047_HYDMR|nr:hypothetical protein [Hydrogenovibrio marinus]KDN95991.1 hypothetical protein EI16_06805 [Hydrogenovibrio marinus]BBN58516.1 hypothetical protein HVMH_0110 [Hydrogenovibrio marinus]